MAKISSKQRLTNLDEPDLIPANLDTLDLSHAIETFHVSTYTLEDLPETLPVFSKRTGRLKRFVGQKKVRVTSMPILSNEYKSLPLLPTDSTFDRQPKRSVSMFPQNDTKDESSSIYSESSDCSHSIPYATAKNVMLVKDEDSLFSTTSLMQSTSGSSVPNESDRSIYSNDMESMLEEIDFSSEDSVTNTDSEIDTTSINSIGDAHVEERCIEEPEIGSIFDSLSLGDSLWNSDKESIQSQSNENGTNADALVLEKSRKTGDEEQNLTRRERVRVAEMNKELPNIPHLPSDSIILPKVRKNTKPRPMSMFSTTNQSSFSAITSPKNLHDSKKDLTFAIGGSINVCLDSDRDYGYSRYYGVGKTPRATSTALLPESNTSFSPIKTSPRSLSAHFADSIKPSYHEAPPVRPIGEVSKSDKLNAGRSVSAFLTRKLRALSSDLRTTNT